MFDKNFIRAFNRAMYFETGSVFQFNNPVVINGDISTKQNKILCGYCNEEFDNGGETKYGIAQNPNPEINVKELNLEQAMNIYYKNYWNPLNCSLFIEYDIGSYLFDIACGSGPLKAAKIFQESLGIKDSEIDGKIGPKTILKYNNFYDKKELLDIIKNNRLKYYQRICEKNPTQYKWLNGWNRRANTFLNF